MTRRDENRVCVCVCLCVGTFDDKSVRHTYALTLAPWKSNAMDFRRISLLSTTCTNMKKFVTLLTRALSSIGCSSVRQYAMIVVFDFECTLRTRTQNCFIRFSFLSFCRSLSFVLRVFACIKNFARQNTNKTIDTEP